MFEHNVSKFLAKKRGIKGSQSSFSWSQAMDAILYNIYAYILHYVTVVSAAVLSVNSF